MKFGRICILPLAVVVLVLFSSTNNVYATVPVVSSFTIQNVDNSDPLVSDGDLLKITFNVATDLGGIFTLNVDVGTANVNNLFDFGDFIGNDYDGKWTNNRTFVITIKDSTASSLQIDSTTFDPSGIQIRDVAFPADIWNTVSPTMQLFIPTGGGDCDRDCQAPTLGLDKNGRRLVENGFSYNENPVNTELFFTPYPLIKTTTGVFNTAKLKIYEDSGPDKISHVELNFGLAKGETINERRASIIWDKHFDGTEFVSVNSPTNAIDSVKIESTYESCRVDSNDQCLVLVIKHRFREPLDFDIVGTNVWDENRNAWQNYFNHGVDVQGESLNPPKQYLEIHNGQLITIIQTGKNTGVDEDGNKWIFDKTWKMNNAHTGKIDDGITSHGYDRTNARFENYKQGQELLAKQTLDSMIRGEIQNNSMDEPITHYADFLKRSEDLELQQSFVDSKLHAYHTFYKLFGGYNQ